MSGDATFFAALVSELQADVGAGSLVSLTGHVTSSPRILRGYPPKKGTLPFLAVLAPSVSAPIKEHTFVHRYVVVLSAFAATEVVAIQIADRVEYLFHKMNAGPTDYLDFSNSNVKVYSSLWKKRIRNTFNEELDCYEDTNIIDIVANPFLGC